MEKGKVVVIDDSPIVRKLAELALEEEGYKVYTASDGEEGLKVAEDISPALILVDFIMPRMSGYEFCKSARESNRLKDVPIILITGKGEDVGKKFIEKFGIADYFIKPFKSETLTEKVNAMILSSQDHHGAASAVDHIVDGYDVDSVFRSAADDSSQQFPDSSNHDTDTSFIDRNVSFVIDRQEPPAADLPVTGDTDLPFLFDRRDFALADASSGPEESPAAEDNLSFDGQIEAEIPEQPSLAEKSDLPFLFKREDFSLHDIACGDEEILSSAVSSSEEATSFIREDEILQSAQSDECAVSHADDPTVASLCESENTVIMPELAPTASDMATRNFVDVPLPSSTEEDRSVQGPHGDHAPEIQQQAADLEEMMDRVVSRYFTEDLPFLIQRSVNDTLKHTGLARSAGLTLSGDLSAVHLLDVMHTVTANRLTGKLSVFSPFLSSEVYFEEGSLIYATTSRHEKKFFSLRPSRETQNRHSESLEAASREDASKETSRSSHSDDAGASGERMISLLRERIVDTFCSLLELRQGTFFVETLILPDSLQMIPLRLSVPSILVEAAHKICGAKGEAGIQDNGLRIFAAYGAPRFWGLSEEELDVLSGVDGGTKIDDLMRTREKGQGNIGDILHVLMKVGLVRTL